MRTVLILTLTTLFACSGYAITHEEYKETKDYNQSMITAKLSLEADAKLSDLVADVVENGQVVAASELPVILIETQDDSDYDLPVYIVSEVSYSSIEEILLNSPNPDKERLPVLVLAGLDSKGAVVSVDAVVTGSVQSIMRPPRDEELLPPIWPI